MKFEVFFDLETKNLFKDVNSNNPADLGVSIVSLYHRTVDDKLDEVSGKMQSFWEKDFGKILLIFQKVDRIIAFNSLGFDVPALQPYFELDLNALPHFDMLDGIKQKLGHRLSLDHLARNTLEKAKSDVGTNAVHYWREQSQKSLAKLKKYCENDVKITRDLYDFVLKNKYIKYIDKWNHSHKLSIDFSYPVTVEKDSEQIGLF